MTTDATPLFLRQQGEGWHLDPKRNLLFKVGGLLLLVALVVTAVSRLADGHPVQALAFAEVGVALAVVPFDRNDARLPARTVTVDGERGLLIPTHPPKVSIVLAMTAMGVVSVLGAVAAVVVGARDGKVSGFVLGVLLAALAALFALGVRGSVKRRRTPSRGILLLRDAVVLRAGGQSVRLPWAEIAAFRDHWSRPGRKIILTEVTDEIDNWLSVEPVPTATWKPDPLHALTGTTSPTISATTLAVDPVEALAILRLHLVRPDLRAGLAEGR